MKPLMVELAKDARRQLQSIGWKTPKAGHYREHFFAIDESRTPFVITLKPAVPDFYDPLRREKAVISREPFPEAVCIEVSPCRLLPPPCYSSREDFEGQLPCHSEFEPWKWVYWQTHHQVLLPAPSDDLRLTCKFVCGRQNIRLKKKS